MGGALISTRGVSAVAPRKVSMADIRETAKTRKGNLASLTPPSEPRFGYPSSPASRIHPLGSFTGGQDREYKFWGKPGGPGSVWNTLHVERPKVNERKRFSSYRKYKRTLNQPMMDDDQLFRTEVHEGRDGGAGG